MRQPAYDQFKHIAFLNTLRSCQLFAGLNDADLAPVAEVATLLTIKKGDYLFHEGEPSTGFYVVQKGSINVHRVSAAGKEQVIHVFRAGESFAEATLATSIGYPGAARALEETVVIQIPKGPFVELLKRRPDLALRMLGSMSQHLRVLVSLLDDLTLKDVETRLANWMLKRCPKPISSKMAQIKLEGTKRMLAAELGTSSETLSRTFAGLRSKGLLKVNGKEIQILRPDQLQKLLKAHLGEG